MAVKKARIKKKKTVHFRNEKINKSRNQNVKKNLSENKSNCRKLK